MLLDCRRSANRIRPPSTDFRGTPKRVPVRSVEKMPERSFPRAPAPRTKCSIRRRRAALCARPAVVLYLAAACWALSSSGCVYHRLVVRSDPPGAQVILDGQEVGNTPVAVPFLYYGTRQLTLVKPGYETRTELVKIPAPWYQYVPIDFVSDNFLPRQVTDRHEIVWQLNPQGVVPLEKLQERADALRSEAHIGQ
jgi:PEGA domain